MFNARIAACVLIVSLGWAISARGDCPSADLNYDCVVDMVDLGLFASQWLDVPGGSANLDGTAGVGMDDFSVMASQWRTRGRRDTVVINEFMADNNNFYFDNAGDDDDWIEIHNYGAKPIDIGGMFITDNLTDPEPYCIPADHPELTTIPAGGFLILWADNEPLEGPLHLGFAISANGGEDIVLSESDGVVIDSILDFGPQAENASYGRMPDAGQTWQTFAAGSDTPPTPNQTNGGRLPEDEILVTEIMYHPYNPAHPLAEDIREEYIELHNRGLIAVSLEGWRITSGVDFTFPAVTIGGGEYLVVAADPNVFATKYPEVANVVGGWNGRLSNSGETIELTTAAGKVIDTVPYADQGDWARRIRGPLDNSHRGWVWADDHDGQGKSLELVNTAMPNEYGLNWGAASVEQGTPGAVNSVDIGDHPGGVAPLIVDARHAPVIPRSTDAVTVAAEVLDEHIASVAVTLHYRADGAADFDSLAMLDDGLGADAIAGDGVFTSQIPAQPDDTVVEFYVSAADSDGNVRTRPAAVDVDGDLQQRCNMLYQVDDSFDAAAALAPGAQPAYYIIMTEVERAELDRIGSTAGEANSNAQMNATFISVDGIDTKVRYSAGVRNRGHGTRTSRPNNCRVNFPTDRRWKEVSGINLNTQYTWVQLAGSEIFQRSGLPTGDAKAVQVRVNGRNLARTGSPQYGSYAHIEAIDSEYADHHFPGNGAGNAYRCMRVTSEADLRYLGADPDPYRPNYFKETNAAQDDWSDLIDLTLTLSDSTPDDIYIQEVERVIDVEQWLRFLALNVLLDNSETTLANGNGDDYYMYRGSADTRFVLIQHDLDSVFGQGQTVGSATAEIFPFMSGAGGQSAVLALRRLVRHPNFAPRYYAQLRNLIETSLSAEQLGPFLDNLLGGFVPQQTIDDMKTWQAQRNAYVLGLIPTELTAESTLPQSGGYYQTAAGQVALGGEADPVRTRSVTVNGLPAAWAPIDARWVIGEGAAEQEESLVRRGSTWRYLDDGSNQGDAWYGMDYNDSAWKGPQAARLGYGGDGETLPRVAYIDIEPNVSGTQKNVTTYFRREFNVDDPAKYVRVRLGVLRDDGAVIYLNDREVWRTNMPAGPIDYMTGAGPDTADGDEEQTFYEYALDSSSLRAGRNVVAVEVHQVKNSSGYVTSSDLGFDLELAGVLPTGQATGVPVSPGINRIVVRAFDAPDGAGNEIARTHVDIWQNAKAPVNLSGTLGQDTTLTAAGGPYNITGDLTVNPGVTLTIEPGVSLFFAAGAVLNVNGRLVAEGDEYRRIRFTRVPGAGNWDGIRFEYPAESPPRPTALRQNNRIAFADVEYCDAADHAIRAIYANVDLDDVSFANSNATHLDFSDSSIVARNCTFGSLTEAELVHYWGFPGDGYALFEGNVFGATTGYNDIIDITGGKLPGPISRFINNVFLGGSDDGIDMDATDAYIEGNVFMHIHQDGPRDSLSHAISTGTEYGEVSNIMVVRNLIYDVDHAFLIKDGSYGWFENNTVVHATKAIANFFEDRSGQWPGVGASFDGNIFYDVADDFINLDAQGTVTDLVVNRSIVPGAAPWPGVGNSIANPLLTRTADVTDLRADFALRAGSPALGSGPNGLDMGGLVPAGPSITGEPPAITNRTEATLVVDGPGITHYRYRVNADPWSEERPISEPIVLSGLAEGSYAVAVIGKNYAGIWQDEAAAAVSDTWTVDADWSRLIVNEVLAHNTTVANTDGTFPDMIELHYDGPARLGLSGMSLSDDSGNPTRFVFPDDTMIDPGQDLVLYADSVVVAGQIHLGFALDDRGEAVYLYDAEQRLIDSVEFGLQAAGLSLARDAAGAWRPAVPTFGAANAIVPLGGVDQVCINEWLAHGRVSFVDDFVEFYNASDFPVDLGGLYITDNPVSQPEKYQIAPLNFIPAKGYAVFDADGQNEPGHLPFRLSADYGLIALLESDSREIDWVVYGPQTADVSQGRTPDGGGACAFFDIPTPGAPNPADPTTNAYFVNLLGITSDWSYDQSGTAPPAEWRQKDYDDSLWPVDDALFYVEDSALPAPKNTPLTLGPMTYYFRTHFTIDPAIDVADILQLDFAFVLDDSAVIYINGREVLRPGFNNDTVVSHGTPADRSVGNAVYEYDSVDARDVTLYPGDNVIAVQVHQINSGSTDIVFGLALDMMVQEDQQTEDPLENPRRIMNSLRVTELMYNSPFGANLDFIELQNIGAEPLDITGVRIEEGVTFTFPEMTLAPGAYTVVVSNTAAFAARYGTGVNVAGQFVGGLSNGGEDLVLRLPAPYDAAVLRIQYSDAWYPATDGGGYALVAVDVNADRALWGLPAGWAAGTRVNGSPGAGD